MMTVIGAFTLSAAAFTSAASASDTPSPSPVASIDASGSADAEILSMLSTQVEVTQNAQLADNSTDSNASEDCQEQSAFNSDILAALLAGDSVSAAQLTAAESIVPSIDAPEISAVASDDAVANLSFLDYLRSSHELKANSDVEGSGPEVSKFAFGCSKELR